MNFTPKIVGGQLNYYNNSQKLSEEYFVLLNRIRIFSPDYSVLPL